MFYLGIDIAKVNHVASLIAEDGSILVKAIKFTNSNEGLQKLIDSISDYDSSQIYCAMEATGILDKVFPEYSDLFSDTFDESSKQILLNCPTPNEVINFNTRKLATLLKKASRGRHSTDKVREVKSLAKNSFGIKFTGDACSFKIKQLVNQIIFLEKQVHELEIKIKDIYSKLDSHLQSISGIGEVTAPIILAEIGDINNFSSSSKLTAFAGIDPSENQSGNKKSSNEKTSKRGSPYLIHAMYAAAMVASNNDPVMHDYYIKKRAEGKHHYVALTGIERKLLGIIFHVLKENRDYRPPKSS